MLYGQGFSGKLGAKTTIALERKLPAAVNMRGNSFSVKATATRPQDNCQKMAADKLQSTVETALIRYNSQLQLEPRKAGYGNLRPRTQLQRDREARIHHILYRQE